jgi:hypothetical protein
MTFNPSIPQPNDLISASQAQIQTNFAQADTAFGIDHTPFSTLANQGQHKKVTLIAPITDPNQAGQLSSVYTKTSGTGVELFYQHGTAGNGVSQLTGGGVTAAAWALFNGTTVGTNPPSVGFNITSIQRIATGQYKVNFTRSFSSNLYVSLIVADLNGTGTSIFFNSRNAADMSFTVKNGSSATDSSNINMAFFGVLA